ncbi:MAG: ABC transporter permease [Anaerolineaceae bacterium]|nr:ABC transporter permease [Anaerolineaceae bacterium]MBN2677491.1 ABC transporter permease [Anaerolineaceae bacterium]
MKSLLKMTWMEAKLFLREPVGAFFTLAFPLMMLFLFGSIYGNSPTSMFNGYGTVDISIPAYTAMIIATTGLMGLTITLASNRENGVLRRLRTTPVSPLAILAAQVIVMFIMTSLGMLFLVLAGKFVYHVHFEGNALSIAAGFVLSCLSFYAIGFILASLVPTARTAQVVGMVLLYPMLFLSGAGFPRELLPETIKKISTFLPLTYVVNLLRGLWIGESWEQHLISVAILGTMLVVGILASVKLFRWE